MLTQKPIGFNCQIYWSVDGYSEECYISFGEPFVTGNSSVYEDSHGVHDTYIFYYADADQIELIEKAIKDSRNDVCIDASEGWWIDLTQPYEYSYDAYDFLPKDAQEA